MSDFGLRLPLRLVRTIPLSCASFRHHFRACTDYVGVRLWPFILNELRAPRVALAVGVTGHSSCMALM